MAKGISIHIGLNSVDPVHYQGWDGQLAGCEFDAHDMQAIAESSGFRSCILLTKAATSDNVLQALKSAAADLETGDMLFLSYSGHGGQVPDTNGDEADDQDETWVLWDRQVVDDELYAIWGQFRAGVRIFVLSDSCHSGTMLRVLPDGGIQETSAHEVQRSLAALPQFTTRGGPPAIRVIPRDVQDRVNTANAALYKRIQDDNPQGDRVGVGASVMLISGCQDSQTSSDGDRNGLFTQTLLHVWNKGTFKGSYKTFYKQILKLMPFYQQPNFYKVGYPSASFERQRPFTI